MVTMSSMLQLKTVTNLVNHNGKWLALKQVARGFSLDPWACLFYKSWDPKFQMQLDHGHISLE